MRVLHYGVTVALTVASITVVRADDRTNPLVPAKAPVKYGACEAYGLDFVYIERVNTCIRIGGLVRIQAQYTPGHDIINVATGAVSQAAKSQDSQGLEIRGRIDIDSRTQSDYGVIQSVIWLRGANTEGIRNAPSATEFATSVSPGGNGATTVTLERAYVKWAGFTLGSSSENFSTMPDYMFGATLFAGFQSGVKQFVYTFDLGGGFSSTIGLESKADLGSNSITAGNAATLAPSLVPYATGVQYNNGLDNSSVLVATLRDDASWGYVQGNVALTKNTINGTTLSSNYNPLQGPTGYFAWAAGASARFLLPNIAAGDEVRFQFAYGNGLLGLVKSGGSLNDVNGVVQKRGVGGVITVPQNIIPVTVSPTGSVTSVGQSSAYSIYGLFTHYWSPEWRTNVDVGYMQVFMPTAFANGTGAGLNTQEGNANLFVAGANLIWSPAKGWDLGVEVDYINLSQKIQNPSPAFVAAGQPGLKSDTISCITRLNRKF